MYAHRIFIIKYFKKYNSDLYDNVEVYSGASMCILITLSFYLGFSFLKTLNVVQG
jgi:hypothetical protein